MTHPGPDGRPSDDQPGEPDPRAHEPAGPDCRGQPRESSSVTKTLLPVVGGVAIIAVVAAASGLLDSRNPGAGDCLPDAPGDEVEVVDCDSADAGLRIVGVDEQELTYSEFMEQTVCLEFLSATSALWVGNDEAESGAVYCVEPV